jgi:hypothetical protein
VANPERLDETHIVDCSSCGKQYGPFDLFSDANSHAIEFKAVDHDCDAVTRPGTVGQPPLVPPEEHG